MAYSGSLVTTKGGGERKKKVMPNCITAAGAVFAQLVFCGCKHSVSKPRGSLPHWYCGSADRAPRWCESPRVSAVFHRAPSQEKKTAHAHIYSRKWNCVVCILTWHAWWNPSRTRWIYFTHPSGGNKTQSKTFGKGKPIKKKKMIEPSVYQIQSRPIRFFSANWSR